MADNNELDVARQLGSLTTDMRAAKERIIAVDEKLDFHIKDEETRLKHIEEQLSLGRFLWLTLKAVVLTVVFILAWKFGDIKGLWGAIK